jgi:hypothetical protein
LTRYAISYGDAVIQFEDERVLRGYEVVEAEGRRWQLKGRHRAADGSEWPDHFDGVPLG